MYTKVRPLLHESGPGKLIRDPIKSAANLLGPVLKVSNIRRPLLSAVLLLNLPLPSIAQAGRGRALFSLDSMAGTPFPSDLFTVADPTQNTGLRVNLPKPDCLARPSDCQDLDVINTLDGFNLQPRLSIPFDGPIDVTTVTSETVFLISLGDTLDPSDQSGHRVGINQVVWDPQMSRNPHGFAFAIADPSALAREIARGAQQRVALFLASGGVLIIHPEPARFFEVPVLLPLPEGLSYIP